MKPEVHVKWYDFKHHSFEGAGVSRPYNEALKEKNVLQAEERKGNSLVFLILVTFDQSKHF